MQNRLNNTTSSAPAREMFWTLTSQRKRSIHTPNSRYVTSATEQFSCSALLATLVSDCRLFCCRRAIADDAFTVSSMRKSPVDITWSSCADNCTKTFSNLPAIQTRGESCFLVMVSQIPTAIYCACVVCMRLCTALSGIWHLDNYNVSRVSPPTKKQVI